MNKIAEQEKVCIQKAKNDETRFADCMMYHSNRQEKELKNLEFRLSFWRHSTHKCFKEVNDNNYAKCKD